MDSQEKFKIIKPPTYPLYKPESARVAPSHIEAIKNNTWFRISLESKLPSLKPILEIISIFDVNTEIKSKDTHVNPQSVKDVAKTLWARYLNFSGVPGSLRGMIVGPVIDLIARNEVSETNKPPGIMLKTFESESQKPVFGEKGHEAMTDSGGVHRNIKVITNCTNTNGEILYLSARRGILGFLQNQERWAPDNSESATKYISEVENNGWSGLSSNPEKVKKEETRMTVPRKTIKDESLDSNDKRLVLNDKKEIKNRSIDLTNGLKDVYFRVFSNGNSVYTDVSAFELLDFSAEELNSITVSIEGFERYKWNKVEDIDSIEDRGNYPLFAISVTDSMPHSESKIDKYMAVRGRSMHINIRDLGDKGRLFEIAGGHLVIDGADQNEYLASYVYDFKFDESISNNFKWPAFMVFPEIPRVEQENSALKILGLSDLILLCKIDPRIESSVDRINEVLLKPEKTTLQRICERVFGYSKEDQRYKKIERTLLPKFSRSSLIQMIASTTIGKMVNCVFYDPQVYYRLGLAVDMPFSNEVIKKIQANIKDGKRILLDDKDLISVNKTIQETTTELALTRLGFSVLGGIRSLVGKYENYVRKFAGFAYSPLLELTYILGFVSDEGVKSKGEVFITAQNHQEPTTSIGYGLVNEMATARINFEYPYYFETLDLLQDVPDDTMDLILQNEPNRNNLKLEIKMVKQIWSLHKEEKNVDTLESVVKSIEKSFPETKEEQFKALRFLLIASAYQNFNNLMNTTSEFAEAYADSLERRK